MRPGRRDRKLVGRPEGEADDLGLLAGAVVTPVMGRLGDMYGKRRMLLVSLVVLVAGSVLLSFGTIFGTTEWIAAISAGVPATAGTVMLSALPILTGVQFMIGFFSFDLTTIPRIQLIRLFGVEQKG